MSAYQEFDDIFDAFLNMSKALHKQDEINRLKRQNTKLKSECGSCYHWMTQQCPRETRHNKVSCGQSICEKFKITKQDEELICKN